MPLKVHFRGPMLFVTDDPADIEAQDVVDRVVIPDATKAGTHADGSRAIPHTAGLLLRERGRPTVYVPLQGRSVTISADGETHAPAVDGAYLSVPPIHEMTSPPGAGVPPVRRRRVLQGAPSTITIRGGFMSGELVTDAGIELPRHKDTPLPWRLCSMPVWISRAAKGILEIAEGEKTDVIALDESVDVYIYNWDIPFPRVADLVAPLDVDGRFQDDDFKWIYDLLQPPHPSWSEWLDNERFLPAPRTIDFLDGAVGGSRSDRPPAPQPGSVKPAGSPPTSTCDSARCRGLSLE